MKKYLIIIHLLLGAANLYAQASNTENYISETNCFDADCVKRAETINYFDGLGRAKQTVNVKASPSEKDVVEHFEYDPFGRQIKDYLPVPQQGTQNGAIYTLPLAYASNLYGTEKIYSENIPENSPLERIKQKIQIGNDWTGHPANYNYGSNTTTDAVRKFAVSTIWENNVTKSKLLEGPAYAINKLFKTTVTDEDGYSTIKFTNSKGQLILKRQKVVTSETGEYIDTYYVYNEYDQLAFVIPSLANTAPDIVTSTTKQEDLCYQYKYDSRYRMVEKKLPGKDWEFLVYDKQDRLIATQDAILRTQGKWLYNKYDQFGRVIMTGVCQGMGTTRLEEQNYADTKGNNNEVRTSTVTMNYNGVDIYYSISSSYPQYDKVLTFLSVNYFDTYPNYSYNPVFTPPAGSSLLMDVASTDGRSTKGLPLMVFVKNIENDNWTKKYNYYDVLGRSIGSYSINHLGGFTEKKSILDFTGIVLNTITRHKRSNADNERVITETFEYDNLKRLKKHWHQVDNLPQELLSDNIYDERSLLSNQKVGNNIQNIDYQYDVRGWLTKINDPADLAGKLFGYQIKYHNPSTLLGIQESKYNGNISEVDWKMATDGILKRYTYKYDGLNRLVYGRSYQPLSTTLNIDYFENVEYDKNGNISTLSRGAKRPGSTTITETIDQLKYTYQGNKVIKISDAGNTLGYPGGGNPITYDANGNMRSMMDKRIKEIGYNFLNLPNTVQIQISAKLANTFYTYRADGVKVGKKFVLGSTNISTDYLDGFQYEKNSLNPTSPELKFVSTSEGYFSFENNKYIYQYKDQVGNIRVSFYKDVTGNAVIDQATDFYPFGLEHQTNVVASITPTYRYGFQKQEKQEETGWSSFKWRNYDPTIGRFFNVDPLSENYTYQSHYNFSENRVIDNVELEGLEGEDYRFRMLMKAKGGVQARAEKEDQEANSTVFMGVIRTLTPTEELYTLASGRDLNGDPASRKEAVKLLALNLVPEVKAEAKAASIVLKAEAKAEAKAAAKAEAKINVKAGRAGKQERLKQLANDPKIGKADKGWIKSEMNQISKGKRKTIRNPPGKDLAHERGREAAKGYSYEHSHLQNRKDHRNQHKYDNGGRKNKERPIQN